MVVMQAGLCLVYSFCGRSESSFLRATAHCFSPVSPRESRRGALKSREWSFSHRSWNVLLRGRESESTRLTPIFPISPLSESLGSPARRRKLDLLVLHSWITAIVFLPLALTFFVLILSRILKLVSLHVEESTG